MGRCDESAAICHHRHRIVLLIISSSSFVDDRWRYKTLLTKLTLCFDLSFSYVVHVRSTDDTTFCQYIMICCNTLYSKSYVFQAPSLPFTLPQLRCSLTVDRRWSMVDGLLCLLYLLFLLCVCVRVCVICCYLFTAFCQY